MSRARSNRAIAARAGIYGFNLLSLAIAATAIPASSAAQETGSKTKLRDAIEEIVVTVNRREQNLQDVAGTAQAFSPEELLKSGVGTDFNNLQNVIPGLQISDNEGFKEIYIRGIGTQSNGPTDDSATAVHFNGVYLPRSRGIGPMMYDLARVEANKGPQGTLRGRNATAGSINFISRKPEFDAIGGYVKAAAGNYDARELEAVYNHPLSDSLAVRAALYHREHDNTYDNALEGLQLNGFTNANTDGVGSEDEDAFRLSMLWEPNDRFSALLVYDQADQSGDGLPGNYFGQTFSVGETVDSLDDPYTQYFLTEGKTTNDIKGFNLVLNYDFGPVTVEYNGGYREHDSFNRNARRPFQFGVVNDSITRLDQIATADFNNFGTNHILDISEAWVHELRVYSPDDVRLQWTAGLFSLDEEQSETRFDTSDRSLGQSSLGGESYSDTDIEAFSIFADATYNLTDRVRIVGGIRHTKDDKSSVGNQIQYCMQDFAASGVVADDVRFSTPGYEPTKPGERNLKDVSAYLLNDPDTENPFSCNGDQANLDRIAAAPDATEFFLDGVGSFGGADTLDDLIANGAGKIVATSTTNTGLVPRSFEESYIDWRAGVEWDINDSTMLYWTVTTGSRSGGINPIIRLTSGELVNSTFDREKLTSWEFGAKNQFELNDMVLTLNANLFFYQYEDQVLQVAGVGDGGGFTPGDTNVNANLIVQNVNIGESEILGLELEGGINLPLNLDLGWNLAYLDAEYTDAIVSDGRQLTNPNVDISGNQMQNVSKWNAVVHLGQEFELDWGVADWRITATYRSEFYATPYEGKGYDIDGNEIALADMPVCCGPLPGVGDGRFYHDKVDGFTLWNINAGISFGNSEQYRVEGFINNLTEETYPQKQIINHFVNIAFLNAPRTGGLRFTVHY